MSAYDDMGADEEELILAGAYDDMGFNPFSAIRRALPGGRRKPAARRQPVAVRLPARPAAASTAARRNALADYQPDATGLPLDQVMPFPNGQFTSVVTTLLLQAQPQREFQPRRLVIDLGRVGATSTGLVQVTQFTVGADPQFVNTGSIPAAMFQATAVGIALKPAAARPGVTVSLGLSLTGALTAPDVINVSAAAVGPAIG